MYSDINNFMRFGKEKLQSQMQESILSFGLNKINQITILL